MWVFNVMCRKPVLSELNNVVYVFKWNEITPCLDQDLFLLSTAGEQRWFYHSSWDWWDCSSGRHDMTAMCDSRKTELAACLAHSRVSFEDNLVLFQPFVFPFLFTYHFSSGRATWHEQWPSLLMGPSRRWLFQCPDETTKPWLASQNSLPINLTQSTHLLLTQSLGWQGTLVL